MENHTAIKGCLLDPPCASCAFGSNKTSSPVVQILIPKRRYGCTKGGGDIVRTEDGVGIQTSTGIRYLTKQGEVRAIEKGYPELVIETSS